MNGLSAFSLAYAAGWDFARQIAIVQLPNEPVSELSLAVKYRNRLLALRTKNWGF
jgi:hypothetical protein